MSMTVMKQQCAIILEYMVFPIQFLSLSLSLDNYRLENHMLAGPAGVTTVDGCYYYGQTTQSNDFVMVAIKLHHYDVTLFHQ